MFATTALPIDHHGLSDTDLVAAMRAANASAWVEFDRRFRPILEAYARKTKIPRWEWSACITEALADEGLRLARGAEIPRRLDAYLIRAVSNKYLQIRRSELCRDRNHLAASDQRLGEWVIPSTCSEDARRASAGPDAAFGDMSKALRRLANELSWTLTDEEQTLLVWVGEGVQRSIIAKWIGVSHDACAKRIWRLCHRLRVEAGERSRLYDDPERSEIERFLRRAGARNGSVVSTTMKSKGSERHDDDARGRNQSRRGRAAGGG